MIGQILPVVRRRSGRRAEGPGVLNIGSGSDLTLAELDQGFPDSRFTGYEFSREADEERRKNAAKHCLKNATLEV